MRDVLARGLGEIKCVTTLFHAGVQSEHQAGLGESLEPLDVEEWVHQKRSDASMPGSEWKSRNCSLSKSK